MARPTLLTPERQERIVELLQSGEYPATVCAEVRISESCYHAWRKRGRDAQAMLDEPKDAEAEAIANAWLAARANEDAKARGIKKAPHPAKDTKAWRDWPERPFVEFVEATKRAEALPERDGVLRVRQAGHGGQLIERTTVTRPDGTVVVTEKYSQPQWQALMTVMSRRWRERWAPSATTEVVMAGEDQGPDPVQEMLHQVGTMRAERQARVVALHGKAKEVG